MHVQCISTRFRFCSTLETYFQSSGTANLHSTITDGGEFSHLVHVFFRMQSYCDVVAGSTSGNSVRSGAANVKTEAPCMLVCWVILMQGYTVSGGSVTLSILPRSAIGPHKSNKYWIVNWTRDYICDIRLHCNHCFWRWSNQLISRHCQLTCLPENISVTGFISQLSNLSTTSAIALSSASYPLWSVTLSMSFLYLTPPMFLTSSLDQ
jgi:hypothetical protein